MKNFMRNMWVSHPTPLSPDSFWGVFVFNVGFFFFFFPCLRTGGRRYARACQDEHDGHAADGADIEGTARNGNLAGTRAHERDRESVCTQWCFCMHDCIP